MQIRYPKRTMRPLGEREINDILVKLIKNSF
jgi:hypothetical protein